MQIFVQTANNKDLFVVLDRLGPKELFWLLQATLVHSQDHVAFSVEIETIADPTIVTAKNQNFRIVQSKRSKCVPWWPRIVFIYNRNRFPLLFVKVSITVKSFNRLKRRLIHWIAPTDDVYVATVMDRDCVVVPWLSQIANLKPLVLRDIVNFALFRCFVGVFRTNCINKVFCLVVELAVQVC